jgi:hypothetical protein
MAGRIMAQGQPREIFTRSPFNKWLGMVVTYSGKLKEESGSSAWPRHERKPHLKINQHENGWRRGSSGKCLPSTVK